MQITDRLKQVSYPYAVMLLFAAIVPLVALSEVYYIAHDDFWIWISLKVLSILIGVPALLQARREQASDVQIGFFFVACCFYTFTSGLYRPLYEPGYFQTAICCAFIPTRNKWIFPSVFLVGAIFMAGLEDARQFFGITIHPASEFSMLISVFIYFLFAVSLYAVIANFRNELTVQTMRLSMLGKNSTLIAHDIKGLLSGPLLHVTALHDRTDEVGQLEMRNAITYLKEDLTNASLVLQKMSEMSRVEEEFQAVPISKIIEGLMTLLQRRLTGIEVAIEVRGTIYTSPMRFRFLLLNVLFNSAEQFARHTMRLREQQAHTSGSPIAFAPKIRITNTSTSLVIEDNAGGMNAEIMRSLKNGRFVSAKGDEGGIGFQIITAETRDLHLSFSFENTDTLGSAGLRFEIRGLQFV